MKKIFIISVIFMIATAISCQKNETVTDSTDPIESNESSDISDEPIMQTYTCIFPGSEDPDSKVSLDAEGKTGWEVGDKIFVHGQKGEKGQIVQLGVDEGSSISLDRKTATFTAAISDPCSYSSTIFVAYPADAVKDNWDTKPYLYWSNRFSNTNNHLITGYNDTQDGGTTIHFLNLCACVSFVVNGDFDGYVFKGNSGETVGYSTYTVRFNNNGGDKKRFYAYVSGEGWCDNTSGPQKTIAVGSWSGADGSTLNKIYIPYEDGGSKVFAGGFTIQFLKGGDIVKTVSTKQRVDLSASSYVAKYMKLGDVTPYLKDYVAPTSYNSSIGCPTDESEFNLSKTETANCYIVDGSDSGNAEKVFKFKATRGNSSVLVGEIKSVELLWETWNDANTVTSNSVIAAVDYDKKAENDYYEICFKMPETLHSGNAVIAAKNAGGTILWSWHIWVPSTTVGSGKYGLSSSVEMQDRNLGALVVAEEGTDNSQSSGLFYQWGRKDPLRAVRSLSENSSRARTAPADIWTTESKQATLEEAKQNPTVMYLNSSDGIWTSDTYTGLWNAEKTENDPCPPGWKVPTNSSIFEGYWNIESYVLSWGTYGFKVGTDGTTVFPYSGFAYYSSGSFDFYNSTTKRYEGTRIWTSVAYSTPGQFRALEVKDDGSHSRSGTGQKMGSACAIRCVKE